MPIKMAKKKSQFQVLTRKVSFTERESIYIGTTSLENTWPSLSIEVETMLTF